MDLVANDISGVFQSFVAPVGYELGETLKPNVIGFGFLCRVDMDPLVVAELESQSDDSIWTSEVAFDWEFYDFDVSRTVPLHAGTQTGATNLGECWIDIYFDPRSPVPITDSSRFQFRVYSKNTNAVRVIYTQTPNPQGTLAGEFGPIYLADVDAYKLPVGQSGAVELNNTALVYRVWADIGETGQDVLGNSYREGVRRDQAHNVLDTASTTAWMSAPCPSPLGVEALYFDVRTIRDDNSYAAAIIDAMRVDPALTGPELHVYFSNENATGPTPKRIDEWEMLLWEPVHEIFMLDKNRLYDMPRPFRASFVKLEFTKLQPVPFKFPEFPALPAILYKMYPSAVHDLFPADAAVSDDHFINDSQFVERNVLDDFRPATSDIYYHPRSDISTLGTTDNSSFGSIASPATLDPVTLSRIYLSGVRQYTQNMGQKTDVFGSVLGRVVNQRAKLNDGRYPTENIPPNVSGPATLVSNTNDRTKEVISGTAVWFTQPARHRYQVVKARFNGKAYMAGVREVQFMRRDFTVVEDAPEYFDILSDTDVASSPNVELCTFVQEQQSNIPIGQELYVSYAMDSIGDVLDNSNAGVPTPIAFEAETDVNFSFERQPLLYGGSKAYSLQVFSGPNFTGTQYVLGQDYDLVYDPDTLTNYIVRNSLHFRLIASQSKVQTERGSAIGHSIVSAEVSFIPVAQVVVGVSKGAIEEAFQHAGATIYIENPLLGTVTSKAIIGAIDQHNV